MVGKKLEKITKFNFFLNFPLSIFEFSFIIRKVKEVSYPALIYKKRLKENIMSKRTDINKVLIIGSGPIIIGQACEFDYSGTQACKALRKLGYEIVLVNSNPATIMTDPEIADVTYIEPLNVHRLEQIIAKEASGRTSSKSWRSVWI